MIHTRISKNYKHETKAGSWKTRKYNDQKSNCLPKQIINS